MNINENEVPAGSVVINPLVEAQSGEPTGQQQAEQSAQDAPAQQDKQELAQSSADIARFEQMLKASQSMIGKQSSEIGQLRSQLEQMHKANQQPQGPSDDQVLNDILRKIDSGELEPGEGMRQALAIQSNLTASQVMSQLSQQQRANESAQIQQAFLKKNPDYYDTLQSGVLDQYMKDDPLSDEYTAYHRFKADERVANLEKEYQQKIAAAKEEGAKLAKGANAAGYVIGRQGASAQAPAQQQKTFKNNQEATDAMMETLRQMRSASSS